MSTVVDVSYLGPEDFVGPEFIRQCKENVEQLIDKIEKKLGKLKRKMKRALILVIQGLLQHMDLSTCQYGMWDRVKNVFKRFTLGLLKKVTGLSDYYIYKCIKVLKKVRYLVVKTRCKNQAQGYIEKGTPEYKKCFVGEAADRFFTDAFFIDLGFSKERLTINQRGAQRRRQEGGRKEARKDYSKPSVRSNISSFSTVSSSSAHRNGVSKTAIKYLSDIKALLKRSVQSLGP